MTPEVAMAYLSIWLAAAPMPELAKDTFKCITDPDRGHKGLLCAAVCIIPYSPEPGKDPPYPDGICRKPVAAHEQATVEKGLEELKRQCMRRQPCVRGIDNGTGT